jgi:hypothetical protein
MYALVLTVCLFLVAVAPAGAQYEGRQTAEFTFAEQRPGRPTAVRLAIDYRNPSDPDAKPPAVQTVVETLAAGARIDTSVPARCGASDGELMTQGAPACPAGSRVGGGEVDLDTGVPGPGRLIHNRVTQFNNAGELILLFEQDGGSRAVSRAKIEGRTIIAQSPPLPGGPPDGFTAIRRVRLSLDAISVAGRGYVTTPDTCPADGRWTNRIAFAYRDGQAQTLEAASPCVPPVDVAPGRDRFAPRIRVGGMPRGCAERAFTLRVRIHDDSALRRVRVRLGRRVLRTTRRKRFEVRVAAGSPGRHRLTIAARDRAGNLGRLAVVFSRCAP